MQTNVEPKKTTKQMFVRFAGFAVIYTIAVIMWGAYVRATGSGAGCGEHWPLCNGEFVPRSLNLARMIEFSHRVTSGLSLVFVVLLFLWSRREWPIGHIVRKSSFYSLIFILGEAAVGALLVILQLVAKNDSVLRAAVIAGHLVNTFLLLFWLTRTFVMSRNGVTVVSAEANVSTRRAKFNILICLILFVLTGAAGAVVALGDTLFPATSFIDGMAQDFSASSHFLIRLRVLHPMVAMAATAYILVQSMALPRLFKGHISRRTGHVVALSMVIQILGGVINWLLLAPVWAQMAHLVFADITWVILCFWYFETSTMDIKQDCATNAL